MNDVRRLFWLCVGLVLGGAAVGAFFLQTRTVEAANGDRYEDYILCTGTVGTAARNPTDGVWLLDYRAGKLLGTIVDRNAGKLVGWYEVDLVNEFGIAPRQPAHFLMTTGQVSQTQAALYVAETTTGKFGVYTMGSRPDGQPGVVINRHDLVFFRPNAPGR
jgi:hypothetical protein